MAKEAIILAGGFGRRLSSVVKDVPKPMAPINGRPFLEILLKSLSSKGIEHAILSLGYMADAIVSHFGENYAGIRLSYAVETQPLGTGGAIRLAMEKSREDHVFVFNGDTYLDLEIDRVDEQWQRRRTPIIVGREVVDAERYGRLVIENGRVIGFTEKGLKGPGVINVGCYVFKRGQLDPFPLQKNFSIEEDYFAKEMKTERFDIFVTKGKFIDIGIPEDFTRAQKELA